MKNELDNLLKILKMHDELNFPRPPGMNRELEKAIKTLGEIIDFIDDLGPEYSLFRVDLHGECESLERLLQARRD